MCAFGIEITLCHKLSTQSLKKGVEHVFKKIYALVGSTQWKWLYGNAKVLLDHLLINCRCNEDRMPSVRDSKKAPKCKVRF